MNIGRGRRGASFVPPEALVLFSSRGFMGRRERENTCSFITLIHELVHTIQCYYTIIDVIIIVAGILYKNISLFLRLDDNKTVNFVLTGKSCYLSKGPGAKRKNQEKTS